MAPRRRRGDVPPGEDPTATTGAPPTPADPDHRSDGSAEGVLPSVGDHDDDGDAVGSPSPRAGAPRLRKAPDDGTGRDVPGGDGGARAPGFNRPTPGVGRSPRRRLIDAKTLAVCALVALIAALTAGLVVARLTDDSEPVVGGLTVAEQVPNLTFERFDDSRGSFGDYRGQPLVVNFWASTCDPCVEEMPDLQRVHTSVGEDVTFLGVNVLDDPEDAAAFAEETGVTYELLRDPDGAIGRAFEVQVLPVTALVAADGTIVDTVFGRVSAARLCDKVNQALLAGSLTQCG